LQTYGKIDSKFRFVILASKRAKQLLRGSKAKIKSKSRNPIRVAQIEVKEGLIAYDILQPPREETLEVEEQVLAVADVAEDAEDMGEGAVDDDEHEEAPESEEDAGPGFGDEIAHDDVDPDKEDV